MTICFCLLNGIISEDVIIFQWFQYAAAVAVGSTSAAAAAASLLCHHQYPLEFAALAVAHKNSSIADLRLKAKKHTEALGLSPREKQL